MTVKSLIALLKQMDQNADVMFAYNYGDYWRTVVMEDVEQVEEEKVVWSDYHDKYKEDPKRAEEQDDDDDDDDDENEHPPKVVVVLR